MHWNPACNLCRALFVMDAANQALVKHTQKWHQLLEEAQCRWHLTTADLAGVQNLIGLAALLRQKFGLSDKRAEAEIEGLAEQFAGRVQTCRLKANL
jgi:hypothetical protein